MARFRPPNYIALLGLLLTLLVQSNAAPRPVADSLKSVSSVAEVEARAVNTGSEPDGQHLPPPHCHHLPPHERLQIREDGAESLGLFACCLY